MRWGQFPNGWQFGFLPRVRPLSGKGIGTLIHENPDGSLVLQMTVRGMNDVKRWVLGYGQEAVVKSPPELVAMVKQEVEGMKQQYISKT
jgi:predicted DNA-binding transcriptional regulator YafY